MNRIIPLLFVAFFFVNTLWAQSAGKPNIDSLLLAVQNYPSNDTVKCKMYLSLGNQFRQTDIDKSILWLKKSIALSEQLKYYKGVQFGCNSLGISLFTSGDLDGGIESFRKCKDACLLTKDSIAMAWAFNNIGNIYIDKTEYQTTIKYYDSALVIRTLVGDSLSIAQSHINFGFLYKDIGDYTKALLHLFKAAQFLEKVNNVESLAYCYNFIGSVYSLRGNPAYSTLFLKKALKLYRQSGDRINEAIAIGIIGSNLYKQGEVKKGINMLYEAYAMHKEIKDYRQLAHASSTLSELYLEQNNLDSAEYMAHQAISYFTQIGTNRQLGNVYLRLSSVYQKKGLTKQALQATKQAYDITKESGEINSLSVISDTLSSLYAQNGDYKQAYYFQTLSASLKDSVKNLASEQAIAQMQVKYETEKKDIEIINQQLEIKKKRTQILLVVLGAISLMVIGVLMYLRYRMKQKALLSTLLLEEQNARNKAIIEAEEKERLRMARELHDGVGQQISAAKMNLSAFEPYVGVDVKDKYHMLLEMVDDAVKEVRTVSHNMMPNALIKQGLASAVRDFVNKMQSSAHLKILLEISGLNERLDVNIETVLYRVLQECMNNIIKHANATEVTIQLVQHTNNLSVIIEDNGKGFDTTSLNHFEGIGLKNIISRIQFLNGTIDFDSTPGHGTTIIIEVPL